jgi:hypothetical protein
VRILRAGWEKACAIEEKEKSNSKRQAPTHACKINQRTHVHFPGLTRHTYRNQATRCAVATVVVETLRAGVL